MRIGLPTLLAVVLAIPSPLVAQEVDGAFHKDIEQLLVVTGASAMGEQMGTFAANSVIDALQAQDPNVPPRAVEIVREVVTKYTANSMSGPNGMLPDMVTIYARHFTHAEVKELLGFYGTDLGRKLIATLPIIVQESQAVGAAWAARIEPAMTAELQARLSEEGFLPE
ncbi:MAG: DUF2059 domain-containing protein [Gemmatimonadales bacterium]|nr:DUF2059 domain-containing protein [Gemmatimonadales bacterium]